MATAARATEGRPARNTSRDDALDVASVEIR